MKTKMFLLSYDSRLYRLKSKMLLFIAFMTVTCMFIANAAWGMPMDIHFVNDTDSLIYIKKSISVMDTLKTKELIEKELPVLESQREEVAHIKDSLIVISTELKAQIDGINNQKNSYSEIGNIISQFLNAYTNALSLGKKEVKIDDASQKDNLIKLFEGISIENRKNIVNEDSLLSMIFVDPVKIERAFKEMNYKQQALDDVRKKIKKGKLDIGGLIYLIALREIYGDLYRQSEDLIRTKKEKELRLSDEAAQLSYQETQIADKIRMIDITEDFSKKYKELFGNVPYPKKDMETQVMVVNEYYRPMGKYDSRKDHLIQIDGWEWAEEHLKEKSVYYPINMTYKFSDRYPEYRILKNCVYDTVGNLIRVLSYGGLNSNVRGLCQELKDSFINESIISDYKNNRYGILEKGNDVKYALENRLGLSKEHNQKINQIDKKATKTIQGSVGKSKRTTQKAAQNVLGMLFDQFLENDRLKNVEADNFIKQCTEDHKEEFGELWKIDRVSDTKFQIYVYSGKQRKIRSWIVNFSVEEPFGTAIPVFHAQPDKEVAEGARV